MTAHDPNSAESSSVESSIDFVFDRIPRMKRSKICPLVLDRRGSVLDVGPDLVDGVSGRLIGGHRDGTDLDVNVTRLRGDGASFRVGAKEDGGDLNECSIGRPLSLLVGSFEVGTFREATCALSFRGSEVLCASDDEYGAETVSEGYSDDVALLVQETDRYARLRIDVKDDDLIGAYAVVELKGDVGWDAERLNRRRIVTLSSEPVLLDDFLPLLYDGSPCVTVRPMRHDDLDLLSPEEVCEVCGVVDFEAAPAIVSDRGWEFTLTEAQLEACCRPDLDAVLRLDLGAPGEGESVTVESTACNRSIGAVNPVEHMRDDVWVRRVDQFQDKLLNLAWIIVGPEAEDVVQEAWIELQKAMKKDRKGCKQGKKDRNCMTDAEFLPYARRTVVNMCVRWRKKSMRKLANAVSFGSLTAPGEQDDDSMPYEPKSRDLGPVDVVEREEVAAVLRQLLRELTDLERDILLMKYYDGMTLVDIASAIGRRITKNSAQHMSVMVRRILLKLAHFAEKSESGLIEVCSG